MPTITSVQANRLIDHGRQDPDWFCRNMLAADLWKMQQDIAASVRDNRYTTVSACHGPGKTFLAGQLAPWFLYTHKPSKVVTIAPTQRQVFSLLWSEIRTAHTRGERIRPLGGSPLKTRLELAPDWFAEGFSTNEYDTEKVTGYHSPNLLIIVDEASGVADNIFDSLEGLMTSGNAHMLYIGNPVRSYGRFFESFNNSLFTSFKISAFDTPNFTYFGITLADIRNGTWQAKIAGKEMPRPYLVTPQWVAERHHAWGEDSSLFRVKILAEFPTGDESDLVIPLAYLDDAAGLFFQEDIDGAQIELGVDIARYGSDESVIASRAGRQPLRERILAQKNTMVVTGAIVDEVNILGPHRVSEVKIDVIGLGAAPVDRLKEMQAEGDFPEHIDVIGVNVAMKPRNQKRFVSQRDELWWNMRELLQSQRAATTNMSPDTIKEFSAPDYAMTSKGQIKVASKEDMRKPNALGRSPDRADAWLLAFGNPIPERGGRRRPVRVQSSLKRKKRR